MSIPAKKRIALVGLGDIAQKAYLPIIGHHPRVTPVLCSRNPHTVTRIADQYRITETYTAVDELIQSKPDAVMLHSTTDSHYELIKKFLNARIPVFVDKPLSYSIKQCEELLDLSIAQHTLLYVGFNRRFAPFIQQLKQEKNPTQITWQKNRPNLPGDPRVFVFDDFIHVIDSLLFLAQGSITNVQVRNVKKEQQLAAVQVQWQQDDTLIQGSMNRISGGTLELIDYYTAGHTWMINDFTSAVHIHNEKQEVLQAGSWESALSKKGFQRMIEDWLLALEETAFNTERIESIRATHRLCEEVVKSIR